MRFRMPNQGAQDLAGGIGNLFRSIAMAPMMQAQAAEEAAAAEDKRRLQQSQIDLHGSNMRVHDSTIGKNLAETAIKNNELATLNGRPDMLRLMAASRAGISVPEFRAAESEMINGAPTVGPSFLSGPIAGVGPSGRTADIQSVIANLFAPAMATPADKLNFDQLAQMQGQLKTQDLTGEAAAAARGGDYMRSSALSSVLGKKEFTPFAAVGNTGTALNQVTGAQPVSNPGLRTLFGDKVGSEISENKAQAGAAGASAGASTALRDLRRVQIKTEDAERGIKALDLEAAIGGQPLPSSNRASRGADSTNSKFRNQVIAAAMKRSGFDTLSQGDKADAINSELEAAGLAPIQHGESLPAAGPGAGAGRGKGGNPGTGAGQAAAKAPAGMKVVGRTPDGKMVYEDKSGKRYTD